MSLVNNVIERLSSERRREKWLAFILLVCPFSWALGSALAGPLLQFSAASGGFLWIMLTRPFALLFGLLSSLPSGFIFFVLAAVVGWFGSRQGRSCSLIVLCLWSAALLGGLVCWALPPVLLGTLFLLPLLTTSVWWLWGFLPASFDSVCEYRRMRRLAVLGKDAVGRVYALSHEDSHIARLHIIEALITTAERALDSVKPAPKVLKQFGWATSEGSRVKVRDVRLLSRAFWRATAPLYQEPIASRFTQDEGGDRIQFKPLARFEWTDGAWGPKDLSTLVPDYAYVPSRYVSRSLNQLMRSTPKEEVVAEALNRFATVYPSERRLFRQVQRAFDTPWP